MKPRPTIRFSSVVIRHPPAARALTMVELMIVIVIIGVLLSSVLVASSHLIEKSKTRNTQTVLQTVSDAVEEFQREQTARPTITKNTRYKTRYGLYPPDELEVFTPAGVPVPPGAPKTGSLAAPPGAVMIPPADSTPYPKAMRFFTDGACPAQGCDDAFEHRDLAAMIVAIETHGDASAAMLAKIPERNRSAGVLTTDARREPAQFLDRPAGLNGRPNKAWDADDLQIRYILDDWGMPISYFSQRDFVEGSGATPVASSNHAGWNEGSTELVRLNGGLPVIFSYGPNGKDQLTRDMMGSNGAASLIADFEPESPSTNDRHHVIDHPANADNVYANPALKEMLSKGIKG